MSSRPKQNEKKNGTNYQTLMAALILTAGLALLIISMAVSIMYGAADIDFRTIWESLMDFNGSSSSHQIIRNLRIPRALAGAIIGAALAMSGAIMQGMTRNALASPSIMGVTAGAMFTMAIVLAIFPSASRMTMMLFAFAGAGVGTGMVFLVGTISKSGLTPVKLALAGTAVTALFTSISTAITIHYNIAKDISFWYAGGLSSIQWVHIKLLAPVAIVGFLVALLLGKSISALNLGEDVAKGLGQQTKVTKFIGTIVVLLLTGASVSVAGTIGFIGLVIPHITRFLVGSDYRILIPCSAVLGGILLVIADTVSRMINPPFETPVGTVTALIGVPFFLYLARNDGRTPS
ncbi:iron ABC transporter permease [Halobacillus salinarum]|uniref:Iron ABC transporter permease n=1 Tax=Halobacillus salinarum TaxID=2932257 RepID=A0ABY4EPN8_9BACI|nr:iron ABC transporter permease [Halobacillus salinarum]UOQ45602.1 iron ABC transporter permease [Halobacillus salinarum]